MKTIFILLSVCCLWVANADGSNFAVSSNRIVIALNGGPFDYPDDPGQGTRSIPSTPISVFLNDDHSIDLEFYQPMGEVEIVISQNGTVVYTYAENVTSPILRTIQLQQSLSGDFLLEIKGENGAYGAGWFTINSNM